MVRAQRDLREDNEGGKCWNAACAVVFLIDLVVISTFPSFTVSEKVCSIHTFLSLVKHDKTVSGRIVEIGSAQKKFALR